MAIDTKNCFNSEKSQICKNFCDVLGCSIVITIISDDKRELSLQQWDEKLITKMKEGDDFTLEQCYRQFSPVIYTVILKICKNKATASDLLQDTFIDAFECISTYKQQASFIAWLKRIAFNNTLNYLNRQKVALRAVEKIQAIPSKEITLDEEISQNDLFSFLMEKVTENERLILWLFIVEQYSHEEIAILVEKSPSYSKSIVSRCLKKLRNSTEVKQYAY